MYLFLSILLSVILGYFLLFSQKGCAGLLIISDYFSEYMVLLSVG
jgi:hypothetical protein